MLAVKASLIFAVALLLVTVLRRQSAALRHLVLTAAMIGVLVLPLLSLARLPAIRISAPAAEALVLETTVTSTAAANVAGRQSSISYNWPKMLGALWLGGSCIGFVRILLALMVLARLRRNATQLDGIVLESAETMMPIAFGVFRPAVALPIPARNWPGERRRAVLDHELAHVERRDPATHLLARLALAAHWWNPFAWLAWKQFLKEQERAADDLVLAGGTAPVDYASHLLEIARGFNTTALAVPMARRSQLESRLSAILDNSVNRRAMTRGGAVVVAVVMAAVLFPIAAAQVAGTTSEPGVVQGRGIKELQNQKFDQAYADFETAGETLWMAVTRERQGRVNEAEYLFREAIERSGQPVQAMLTFATFPRAQDRTEEAQAMETRARAAQTGDAVPELFGVYRVGNGVAGPAVLSKIDPDYTEEAKLLGLSGMVTLFVEIDPDGMARNITVTKRLGMGLDDEAVKAVGQWRFRPGMKDGQAVPVRATIEVNFRLR